MRRSPKLPLDPKRSAAIAGLQYLLDGAPGVARRRYGKGFAYFDSSGHRISDKAEIRRIRSLAIPPAWTKVWICPNASGHLQAIGFDSRGRKQYRYHAAYRIIRNETKFDRIPDVAAALPGVRKSIREHLNLSGMPREKVLAAVIRVLDMTGIRIGNEESATENKTFGLTTLRNQHVEISGGTLRFRFTGKSGVKQEVEISDPKLARVVRQCHDLPGHNLFEYIDDNGELRGVSSTDVNAYLREVSGENLTAKDFRTWAGTVECAVALRDSGDFSTLAEGRKNIVAAIKTAAQRLGNRAATCRAYYVHPGIPAAYLERELITAMQAPAPGNLTSDFLTAEERAVLKVIRRGHARAEELRTAAG